MASLADLYVGLKVNASGFTSGLKRAKDDLAGFASGVGKIGGIASAALASIGGMVGAAGLTVLTKQSMTAMDKVSKLSDQLGISTESLTSFHHAAELTGAGAEAMDKGLAKMAINLTNAAEGSGPASDALKILGLNIDDIMKMSPDKQFASIADAMGKIPNQSQKNALAMDIFGKSGMALVNTMAMGSKGLADTTDEAKKLGISFTRVDGAKIEMANDALTRMGSVFTGIGNTVAIAVAPYIKYLSDQFTSLATEGGGIGTRIVDAFKWVGKSIIGITDYLNLAKAGFFGLASGGMTMAETIIGYGLEPLLKVFGRMADTLNLMKGGLYGIASVAVEVFGSTFTKVVREAYIFALDKYNNLLRATGHISDAEERKRFGQTRINAQNIANIDPGLAQSLAAKSQTAYENFQAGTISSSIANIGGRGLSDMRVAAGEMAKSFADQSVAAYGAYQRGDMQNSLNDFIASIAEGAQSAAEEIAANSPALKAASGELPSTPEAESKSAGKAGGTFWGTFAGGMLAQAIRPPSEIKEQLKETKKTNRILQQILNKDDSAAYA